MCNRILIAQIATAHGIKGFVKLRYFGEDVNDIKNYNPLFTSEDGRKTLTFHIKNPIKNAYVAEIEGITDRNEAEELRGQKLYVDESKLAPPEEGAYFQKDLIGCEVYENDKKIGKVIAIDDFGAGDLLDIQPPTGQSFYLPFKDEFVKDIDISKQKIDVVIPEGLLE